MALTGSVNTAEIPVPVRFGGVGSTSSERDCIIIGEFTPQMTKVVVRVKGIGKNQKTGIDNREYERSPGNTVDGNLIGVVGRGFGSPLLAKQPEGAMAIWRGLDDIDAGDNYAACVCVCESGEIRYRRQFEPASTSENDTLTFNGVQTPDDFYTAVADLTYSPELSAELVWTFEFEKVAQGQTRQGQTSVASEDLLVIKASVDWPYEPAGVKEFEGHVLSPDGNAFYKNAYLFIGNPFAFWPAAEANAAIAGVQVLSIEYFDAQEPVVSYFNLFGTADTTFVPLTDLTADDNVGVVAYMVSCPGAEPTEKPAVDDSRWSPVPPNYAAIETPAGTGDYVFYPWVKDAAGNINSVANAIALAYTTTVTLA